MRREVVPAPTDILCESCGYLLNGLPDTGNCPECGAPVAESTTASPRHLPAWERTDGTPARRFQSTFFSLLRSPGTFFRDLSIYGDVNRARQFGLITLVPTILFNSKTIIIHYLIMEHTDTAPPWLATPWVLMLVPVLVTAVWIGMYLAVVKLTAMEARFWGLRLPTPVVRRALPYIGAYAAVISLLPLAVVSIYVCLVLAVDRFALYLTTYLFVLSGSVVFAALYVFRRYWQAMRLMLNANR